MKFFKIARTALVFTLSISLGGLAGISPSHAALMETPKINLCLAGNYATLSYVLTNAAGVVVRSDTPGTLIGASSPVEADGFLHPGDNLVSQHSEADYVAAMGSLRGAIDSIKTNILPSATILNGNSLAMAEITPGQLGVFPEGVYATTAAMSISANQHITLTGDANSVFVFISGEAFNVGANVQILLSGGAQAKNVYWIVGTFVGAHTAGASSTLVGNYLVDGTMSVGASTQLTGRILAMNTITFGADARLNALPPATSCGASVMSQTKTIEFTDTTLVAGIKGQAYLDFVAARTLLNGVPSNQPVTYSISPSLAALGLSMDGAGVVTGTVSNSATVGTFNFTVSATSVGYVTQTYVYPLAIQAADLAPLTSYVTVKLDVYFSPGSSIISGTQKVAILRFLAKVPKKTSDGTVLGYVQRTGYDSNDTKLSSARARVIAKFLVDHGVKAPLVALGKGVLNGSSAARVTSISLRYKSR
jgi:outer membrane protein OmpA-like peptidoglycan-associated protein